MRGPKPIQITLQPDTLNELEALIRKHTAPQQMVLRANIILLAYQGLNNQQIVNKLSNSIQMVQKWRKRWKELQDIPFSEVTIENRLSDAPRMGAPAKISPEAYCQIMAIACQTPDTYGRPITHWTPRELAEEAIKQNIVSTISTRQVGRFLKRSGY